MNTFYDVNFDFDSLCEEFAERSRILDTLTMFIENAVDEYILENYKEHEEELKTEALVGELKVHQYENELIKLIENSLRNSREFEKICKKLVQEACANVDGDAEILEKDGAK